MTDFPALLKVLTQAGVDFVIVGGAAATVHGSARLTQDLDIVYDRNRENLLGVHCLCLSLEALIAAKRAAGRPRDLEAIAELEIIREEKENSGQESRAPGF
jgi:predicted nucleotidyltransferase